MPTTKIPYQLCWDCNRKFRGAHHRIVETENGLVAVHVQCAERLERDGMIIRVNP